MLGFLNDGYYFSDIISSAGPFLHFPLPTTIPSPSYHYLFYKKIILLANLYKKYITWK